jgi:isopenicillin N synthase-like dioxygenase
LEPAAKHLGGMMKDIAVLVSKHIDAYARSKNNEYPDQLIHQALVDSEKVKGRLLYYFPLPESQTASEDSWIGWHNDSGFLTALAGDLYMDKAGNVVTPPPSSLAGLYVAKRNRQVQKVEIPPNVMAIQIGECTQIMTGEAVVATPHCVRGAPNLARTSLACFIDVPPAVPLSLPPGSTPSSILSMESERVPTLDGRWVNGIAFGAFLQKTFEAYYKS